MDWQDEGLILSSRPHGETSVILEVLTRQHGRHLGVVRGGQSRRLAPELQPGNQLALEWKARLTEHLGSFQAELMTSRSGLMADPLALTALGSLVSLLHLTLPERSPAPRLHDLSRDCLDLMTQGPGLWQAGYVRWELALLSEIGAGLDLDSCAVTGELGGLTHVSPRTGRAVQGAAVEEWRDRLLPLPGFLIGSQIAAPPDILAGLRLTGHFLDRTLTETLEVAGLPPARARLIARLERSQDPAGL